MEEGQPHCHQIHVLQEGIQRRRARDDRLEDARVEGLMHGRQAWVSCPDVMRVPARGRGPVQWCGPWCSVRSGQGERVGCKHDGGPPAWCRPTVVQTDRAHGRLCVCWALVALVTFTCHLPTSAGSTSPAGGASWNAHGDRWRGDGVVAHSRSVERALAGPAHAKAAGHSIRDPGGRAEGKMMSEGFSANGRRDGEVVDGGVEDRDGWDSSATPHYPLISSFLMCGGLILMAVACYCARGDLFAAHNKAICLLMVGAALEMMSLLLVSPVGWEGRGHVSEKRLCTSSSHEVSNTNRAHKRKCCRVIFSCSGVTFACSIWSLLILHLI